MAVIYFGKNFIALAQGSHVILAVKNKLECEFVSGNPFQPCLKFGGKARSLP